MARDDYHESVRRLVLDEASFVELRLTGNRRGQVVPWRMVTVRPVLVRGRRHLQFSYYDERKHIAKNYRDAEAESQLDEALALPFNSIEVQTARETLRVQITRKGKALFHRNRPAVSASPDLAHDRRKDLPLPDDRPDPFLQAVGIMDARGRVRPRMRDKFTQVNEFLKLMDHTGVLETFTHTPVHILDCGCGSAYLTLAAHHYLNHVRAIPARLTGVDIDEGVVEKSRALGAAAGLGEAVCFSRAAIIDYTPPTPPDIVLALHACDTATDEAIAQGVRLGARLILCVPCCHHHLHRQLERVAPFGPVMRDGILKKRLADILTDTFRAQALRLAGYRTDVVEFVSTEHTDRNLMIRAVKRDEAAPFDASDLAREYDALKAFWGVTPYLETLLHEPGRPR